MARKKAFKPLFAVKHDFVESMDNFIQVSLNLYQAAKTAVDLGKLSGPAADRLKECMAEWEKATLPDDGTADGG